MCTLRTDKIVHPVKINFFFWKIDEASKVFKSFNANKRHSFNYLSHLLGVNLLQWFTIKISFWLQQDLVFSPLKLRLLCMVRANTFAKIKKSKESRHSDWCRGRLSGEIYAQHAKVHQFLIVYLMTYWMILGERGTSSNPHIKHITNINLHIKKSLSPRVNLEPGAVFYFLAISKKVVNSPEFEVERESVYKLQLKSFREKERNLNKFQFESLTKCCSQNKRLFLEISFYQGCARFYEVLVKLLYAISRV